MAADHFSSIEITSVVFLAIFTLLIIPSIYLWIKYMRAGYPWRYGFWGAFLICAARIACFISELVFYSSHYRNIDAAIAYIVTLAIGYIGLLECESALFVTWAETHIDLSPRQQQIHGKVRLLNIAGMVLLIYGSTEYGANGSISSTGAACIQAGTIIFLVLTVVQSLFLWYGWRKFGQMTKELAILCVVLAALYVRIIFGVYTTFHRDHSAAMFKDSNVKYLVGATLVPEVVALVLMIVLGFRNTHVAQLPQYNSRKPEAYPVSDLDARQQGQTTGVRG
ncbi:hypothetical protein ABW19_dt0201329 [Dactylella cylindrospora]|nr:hypothetical protein ABW19_dt0201329 [Dactylella cylindrospora]